MKRFFNGLWVWTKNFVKLLINWKFLLSFGIAWILFNGIWYVGLGFGIVYNITWLKTICGAYVTMLYMPWTAEKLITVPLGIVFAKWFFPKDIKLRGQISALLPTKKQLNNQ